MTAPRTIKLWRWYASYIDNAGELDEQPVLDTDRAAAIRQAKDRCQGTGLSFLSLSLEPDIALDEVGGLWTRADLPAEALAQAGLAAAKAVA